METETQENEVEKEINATATTNRKQEISFKKPTILIGKIGRLPRKVQSATPINNNAVIQKNLDILEDNKSAETIESVPIKNPPPTAESNVENEVEKPPPVQQNENSLVLPYREPSWSGMPETSGKPYTFEVLKNGSIIETIDLMKKPFWVFGRLANCDICMQHPTISRYHAVLQYRDIPSEDSPPGFYIYDLGSTHGTFLNGKNNKLKPRVYAPVRVGHMIRLGCSQRSYILTGPEDDQEEESELSVTELKQLRDQKIREHEERMRQAELDREAKQKREEEKGVDWGIGDDDEVEEDLTENPYASTNNEELYLDDPKKALRGFFEREGVELEYDCTEQGMGQFLCKVELPLDDEMGRPIIAEVLHKGKKKEAVVQCALEACRILDRFGVLRQATHESKKRKARNWEENDYYDSDEDPFLDRTGTIEKKREKRMKAKEPEKAETYESLIEKEKQITVSISEIEKKLGRAQAKLDEFNSHGNTDEDSLDSYMKGLNDDRPDKQTISKLKLELANLRKNHANVIRLVNIARPANLPSLMPAGSSTSTSNAKVDKHKLPIFGKRRALPIKFPAKPSEAVLAQQGSQILEDDEEEESDEESQNVQNVSDHVSSKESEVSSISKLEEPSSSIAPSASSVTQDSPTSPDTTETLVVTQDSPTSPEPTEILATQDSPTSPEPEVPDSDSSDGEPVEALHEFRPIKTFHDTETFKKFEKIMRTGLPAVADKHKQKLVKILRKLQRLASNEDRMHSDWKTLSAKKRKVMKWIAELRQSEANEKLEFRVSTELNRILNELNTMTEDKFKVIGQVKQMGYALKSISMEIDKDIQELKKGMHSEDTSIDPQPGSSKEPDVSSNQETNQAHDSSRSTKSTESPETEDDSPDMDVKKKKKNQKRNEQRQYKAEVERQRGYEEDASRENYSMWVPPNNQSGDGRTSLNDKFGY